METRTGCDVARRAQVGDNPFLAAHPVVGGAAVIGERCFLGLNSTVREGVTVALCCFVAAGALLSADTEPDGIHAGVPAKRLGSAGRPRPLRAP